MANPSDKFSGGKTVPFTDLRMGTSAGRHIQNIFKILQWNAGGLTQSKKTELQTIIEENGIDVFIIQEANVSRDQLKYFQFPGFNIHILPKARQVASGILAGVRTNILSKSKVIKEMQQEDKVEIIQIEIWKGSSHYNIYGIYNPPNNNPCLDIINIYPKTILIGDFNGHSPKWLSLIHI